MKRWNLRESFIGEPSMEREGTHRQREGYDAVELEVKGGKVTLVVPASTPDSAVCQPQAFAQSSTWELELEGGRVITFQLPEGAIGASVHVTPSK
ncbi:MAG: hypothetical protein H8D78_06525 [Chloroflexi bacterium]|nr:hypothetical protein [Chloroflexota bacterium]